MKKQLLLFLLAVITALSGYAADFQLEATTTGYRINGGSVVSFSGSIAGKSFNDAEITVSFAKGSGGSNPQINSSGYFQLYAGNTMTITRANSEKLSSANIVVAGTSYNLSNCTASNGTITGSKWQNANATTVTLTVKSSQQVRFSKLTVEYTGGSSGGLLDPELVWKIFSGKPSPPPHTISPKELQITPSAPLTAALPTI